MEAYPLHRIPPIYPSGFNWSGGRFLEPLKRTGVGVGPRWPGMAILVGEVGLGGSSLTAEREGNMMMGERTMREDWA